MQRLLMKLLRDCLLQSQRFELIFLSPYCFLKNNNIFSLTNFFLCVEKQEKYNKVSKHIMIWKKQISIIWLFFIYCYYYYIIFIIYYFDQFSRVKPTIFSFNFMLNAIAEGKGEGDKFFERANWILNEMEKFNVQMNIATFNVRTIIIMIILLIY